MKFTNNPSEETYISPIFDLAHFLQMELLERQQKNRSYSLRSFARDIDISPAHLSQIISRQRTPSVSVANKCINSLKVSEFVKGKIRAIDIRTEKDKNEVVVDKFTGIVKWHEIALISTIKSNPGIHYEDLVTEKLVNEALTKQALLKLERAEIIYTEGQKYYACEVSKSMYKAFLSEDDQRQTFESFSEQTTSEIYDNFNMILLMNEEDLGYAVTKFEQFFINMTQELARKRDENPNKSKVYFTSMGILNIKKSKLLSNNNN